MLREIEIISDIDTLIIEDDLKGYLEALRKVYLYEIMQGKKAENLTIHNHE